MSARPDCGRWPATTTAIVTPAALLLAAILNPAPTWAELSPESPEVKQCVARAVEFLETTDDRRLGGAALIGLALYKAGADADHPKVQAALKTAAEGARTADIEGHDHVVYSTALCIVFLATVDAADYRSEIELHLSRLLRLQKAHGGWGYPAWPTGDTSMTQMAVLALWEAGNIGLDVPATAKRSAAGWLLRTQDPSGGFGYQGQDPGSSKLIEQIEVRISLTTGALGSLYILGRIAAARQKDRQVDSKNTQESDSQPPRRRGRAGAESRPQTARIQSAIDNGQRWMRDNFEIRPNVYANYYLYALERYEAFREVVGEKPSPTNWYDQGARHLIDAQREDGSWTSNLSLPIDTAFAVLFLIRSTQQRLERTQPLGSGMQVGGRGIPRDLANVKLRDGKLVAAKITASADKLLALMEDPTNPDYLNAVEAFQRGEIGFDAQTASKNSTRLRKLLAGKNPTARAVAIRALYRRRNLDDVPLLIAALKDRESEVVRAARDGLRFISRRPDGFGLSEQPDERQRREAIARWKAWYRSLRPDAKLDK